MATCRGCGRDAQIVIRLQEVLTLRIRALDGERRVQALGAVLDEGLCHGCLDAYIGRLAKPGEQIGKAVLLFGGIALSGLALLIVPPLLMNLDLSLPGAAAVLMGAAGLYVRLREIRGRRETVKGTDAEENRGRYAFEYLAGLLPKKEGENDLSYVPLDGRTAALNPGALAAAYGLLPQIAQQLAEKLRGGEEEKQTQG